MLTLRVQGRELKPREKQRQRQANRPSSSLSAFSLRTEARGEPRDVWRGGTTMGMAMEVGTMVERCYATQRERGGATMGSMQSALTNP